MSSDWVMALDNLAAGGTIDFDAAAYILGKPARFVGNPRIENLPTENPALLPDDVKIKSEPKRDTYGSDLEKGLDDNPNWKKWLFGIIAVGLIAAGGVKLLSKNTKMPKMTEIKDFGNKVLDYIKKPFNWVKSKLSRK